MATAKAKARSKKAKTPVKVKTITAVPKLGGKDESWRNVPTATEAAQGMKKVGLLLTNMGTDKLTPFGHRIKSQGGMIDMAILNGAYTISAIEAVTGVKPKRIRDHIHWSASGNKAHGGLVSRLSNLVPKNDARKLAAEIQPLMTSFSTYICDSYKRIAAAK